MLALLEQQSSAMFQMMALRNRPRQLGIPMGTGRDDLETGSGISGARGCAARDMWRAKLLTHHVRAAAAMKVQLAQALSESASSLDARAMHELMEKIGLLGQYKMLTYAAFLLAELWRPIEEKDMEGLRSLAASAAIFLDQILAFLGDMDLVLERTKEYASVGQGQGRGPSQGLGRRRGKGQDMGEGQPA